MEHDYNICHQQIFIFVVSEINRVKRGIKYVLPKVGYVRGTK